MPIVSCSADGCSTRLQPVQKVDPRDRDTWLYPECDRCFRPCCAKHSALVGTQLICDRCRGASAVAELPLLDLGMGRMNRL